MNNSQQPQQLPLDKRLLLLASFVRLDKCICDIGTDHAILPCYLRQLGAEKVIATDVADGPLATAKRTMTAYNIDGISLVKSDGLANIDYADDLIIAGMGGLLIANILAGCRFIHDDLRLILQPMTHPQMLRKALYQQGFDIIEEKAVQDGHRHYCVIYAKYSGKAIEVDDVFAYVGKMTDKTYLTYQKNKLSKIVENIGDSQNSTAQKELNLRIIERIGELVG